MRNFTNRPVDRVATPSAMIQVVQIPILESVKLETTWVVQWLTGSLAPRTMVLDHL